MHMWYMFIFSKSLRIWLVEFWVIRLQEKFFPAFRLASATPNRRLNHWSRQSGCLLPCQPFSCFCNPEPPVRPQVPAVGLPSFASNCVIILQTPGIKSIPVLFTSSGITLFRICPHILLCSCAGGEHFCNAALTSLVSSM